MSRRLLSETQFGLLSAIVVLSLLGVLLAFHANRVHRDRAAVAMIDRLGGTFRVRDPGILIAYEDGRIDDHRTWKQRLRAPFHSELPSEIVEVRLGGPSQPLRPADSVGISRTWRAALDPANKTPVRFPEWEAKIAATDADVARLRGLPLVEYLDLSYTHVTDAAIDDLCSLPRLRLARLEGTRLPPNGLSELRSRRPDPLSQRLTLTLARGSPVPAPARTPSSASRPRSRIARRLC